jgi:hypothetical protein
MDAKQRNKILLLLFVGVLMGALDIAIVGRRSSGRSPGACS